jgi:hypothetical protein
MASSMKVPDPGPQKRIAILEDPGKSRGAFLSVQYPLRIE